MAVLPTADDLGTLHPSPTGRTGGYTPNVPVSPFSQLDEAGKQLMAIGAGIQDKQDKFDYLHAKTEFYKAQMDVQSQLDANPTDYMNREKKGIELLTPARTQLLGTLKGDYQKQFDLDTQEDMARFQFKQRDDAMKYGNSFRLGQNDDDLEETKNALINTKDPAIRAGLLNHARELISTRPAMGEMPEQSQAKSRAFVKDAAIGSVDMMGYEDVVKTLDRFKPQPEKDGPPAPEKYGPTAPMTQDKLYNAFSTQESSNNANVRMSVDGAIGKFQILPATFAMYAKPGEVITNPADNAAVGKRILDDYAKKYNGDPARIAVAYFSGPGNVSPPGSDKPYLVDHMDGNGKRTSDYANDISKRVGGVAYVGGTDQKEVVYHNGGDILDFAPHDDLKSALETKLKSYKEEIAKAQSYSMVQNHLNGTPVLDPTDTDDIKSANLYFNDVAVPHLKDMQPAEQTNYTMQFIKSTNVVPDVIKKQLVSNMAAGTPEQKAAAASQITQMVGDVPFTKKEFDEKTLSKAYSVSDYMSSGMQPKDAVMFAEKDAEVSKPVTDLREAQAKTEKHVKLNQEFLDGQSSPWFSSNPSVPDELRGEFNNIQQRVYLRTGNLEASQKTAWDLVNKDWAVTEIGLGGKRWQKYAPENYGVPGTDNASWMQKQLLSDVSQAFMFDPDKGDIGKRITLMPDDKTARQAGANMTPSWQVWMLNDSGVLQPLTGKDGVAKRFSPDFRQTEEYKKLSAGREELLKMDNLQIRNMLIQEKQNKPDPLSFMFGNQKGQMQ